MTRNTFLIADKLLYQTSYDWLVQSSYVLQSEARGVAVFKSDAATAIVVNPDDFSLAELAAKLRDATIGTHHLDLLSPSIIQYFASRMTADDPIFAGINKLSQYPVAVMNTPVFRMLHRPDGDRISTLKHQVTSGGFPERVKSVQCHYVTPKGELVDEKALGLTAEVTSVAAPMVFYHSGLALQKFEFDRLVVSEDADKIFGYERMAFDELMIRFPSREAPSSEEVEALSKRFSITPDQVHEIWNHNREQWNAVRREMKSVGLSLPGPTKREAKRASFHQFTHLLMAGTNKLVARMDVPLDSIRHIGIPILARNGVTIPLGAQGIVKKPEKFDGTTIVNRIHKLLPLALKTPPLVSGKTSNLHIVETV